MAVAKKIRNVYALVSEDPESGEHLLVGEYLLDPQTLTRLFSPFVSDNKETMSAFSKGAYDIADGKKKRVFLVEFGAPKVLRKFLPKGVDEEAEKDDYDPFADKVAKIIFEQAVVVEKEVKPPPPNTPVIALRCPWCNKMLDKEFKGENCPECKMRFGWNPPQPVHEKSTGAGVQH